MPESIPGHMQCGPCGRQWIGVASERCPFCVVTAAIGLQRNLVKMATDPKPQHLMYQVGLEAAGIWLYNAITGEEINRLKAIGAVDAVAYCGAPTCSRIATYDNGAYQACDAHLSTAPPAPGATYQPIKNPSLTWRNS